ncbi:hypothetical protein AB1N83_008765 [Pleurotus pulmonarius]
MRKDAGERALSDWSPSLYLPFKPFPLPFPSSFFFGSPGSTPIPCDLHLILHTL